MVLRSEEADHHSRWLEYLPTRGTPLVTELIALSRARVGYKAPDEIVVLVEMPTSAVSKVDRVGLKQTAEANVNQHLDWWHPVIPS